MKRCSRSPRAGNERWRAAGAVTYGGRLQTRSHRAPPVAIETASGLGRGSASCRCQRHYRPGGNRQGGAVNHTHRCPAATLKAQSAKRRGCFPPDALPGAPAASPGATAARGRWVLARCRRGVFCGVGWGGAAASRCRPLVLTAGGEGYPRPPC